jgi:hypothetical protein
MISYLWWNKINLKDLNSLHLTPTSTLLSKYTIILKQFLMNRIFEK